MSNLLERMVQAIRAPQTGVEPLLQPAYAWQGGSGSRSWTERGDGVAPFLEENALAQAEPESGKYHLDSFGLGLRADHRDVQRQQGGSVNGDSASEPPATAVRRSSFKPSIAQSSSDETSSVPQADQQDRGFNKRAVAPPSMPTQSPASTTTSALASAAAKSTGMPRQAPAVPERPSANARDVGDTRKQVKEQPGMTRAIPGAPLTSRRLEDAHAMQRSDRHLSTLQAGGEKTSTVVTISIGHVEVRAEQLAERPRRPAFRPRVSLSDFLSQKKPERL